MMMLFGSDAAELCCILLIAHVFVAELKVIVYAFSLFRSSLSVSVLSNIYLGTGKPQLQIPGFVFLL